MPGAARFLSRSNARRSQPKKGLGVPDWHSIAGDRFKIAATQKSHLSQHRQQPVPSIHLWWSR